MLLNLTTVPDVFGTLLNGFDKIVIFFLSSKRNAVNILLTFLLSLRNIQVSWINLVLFEHLELVKEVLPVVVVLDNDLDLLGLLHQLSQLQFLHRSNDGSALLVRSCQLLLGLIVSLHGFIGHL